MNPDMMNPVPVLAIGAGISWLLLMARLFWETKQNKDNE